MNTDKYQIKKGIGTTLFLVALGLCILLYCEWRGNFAETFVVCQEYFIALPFFAVVLTVLYSKKEKRAEKADKPRKMYLDYARILAAVCVILAHACNMQRTEQAAAWRINLLTICAGLGLVCNSIYVMISGSLLLSSKKKESLWEFYYGRFVKVVIPLVVYYAIFLCVSGQMSFLPPENIGKGFLQILKGESDIVPHYWLIYTLISLYIFAPFVKIFVGKFNDKQLKIGFWLILAMEQVLSLLPLWGIQITSVIEFVQWEGVFILGYILPEKRSKKMENAVLVLGGISVIAICAIILGDYSYIGYVCNAAPVMVLFGASILILLSKIKYVPGKYVGKVIKAFAKYSYSVILVHWYGLFVVAWGKMGFQPLRFGCIGGIVLTVTVATGVCFLMGFVGDNTVVFAVQSIFELPYKMMKEELKKCDGSAL